MSELVLLLMTICITISLVLSIVMCICRKSKTNSSYNNSHNLLPLNSIRSTDLTTNLELIRYNGSNCLTNEEADNHLRHCRNQRALPDIPSTGNPLNNLTQNEFDMSRDLVEPNENEVNVEPMSRPTKARAPQPPTHRVMTCPAVPNSDDLHHSYARIKDNAIIDSSENETDDYCDPQFCSVRPIAHKKAEEMSPPVPIKRFANDLNTDLPFIGSNPSTSRAAEMAEMSYMSPSAGLHLNHSNMDSFSHSSNDENRSNANKTEISYNTISVREPLAKVLAERANSEHHYNEVEEERVSSFYEEIAGSTASSVTYSKIGDILSNNNNVLQNSTQETQSVNNNSAQVVHSFDLDTTDSASTTPPQQYFPNITSNCDSLLANNYPKDLYSSVDKKLKSKSYNRQTIHCVPDSDNQFDNLYAKVQKVNNALKDHTIYANQRPNSVSEIDSSLIPDSSIPPPLPPPLKSFPPNQTRSVRTISMYDSSNPTLSPNPTTSSHQRRYSSGTQSINTNDWHKRDLNNDYFNYGTVENDDSNPIDLDSDPGYEVIHKKPNTRHTSQPSNSAILLNGVHSASGVDPEYEAIRYLESDFDPNYETISKKVNTSTQMNETVDPGYEVIKRVPQIRNQTYSATHFDLNISRNVSDVSSEPGYERIRFTQRYETSDEVESEPNYAYIGNNTEYLYEEDGEDETLSERL